MANRQIGNVVKIVILTGAAAMGTTVLAWLCFLKCYAVD